MRIVGETRSAMGRTTSGSRSERRNRAAGAQHLSAESRAVVAVEPIADVHATAALKRYRHNAPFLAQLIAHHEDMPQTRARRRAPAPHALDAYARAERAPRHMDAGRVLVVER